MRSLQLGMGWFPEQAGGLNRVYYDCIHHLPAAGVDLRGLVAGSEAVTRSSQGTVQSFAPREAPLWQRWQGLRQSATQLLSADRYELVASHFALYTLPLLDQLRRYPLVMHFHGPWALEGTVEGSKALATRFKRTIEQLTYRRTTHFIVLSNAFRQILHQEYRVPWEKIAVIPSGINTQRFDLAMTQAAARNQLNWPHDRRILLAVRRLAQRMGLENLIQAIAQIRQTHPEILLLIAGKGSLEPLLRVQIQELNLSEHVQLLGYVPDTDLGIAYRAADLTIVPTIALEGFGLIIPESLAAGTPVLGTPIGGIPEILRPLSTDLVLEGSSVEHLTQGILEAIAGKRHLPTTEQCKQYVQQHYSWSMIAQQIHATYLQAI